MRTVKLAMLGCGGIARMHINWLKAIPEARIVALCDTVKERAEERRNLIREDKNWRMKLFADYDDMLKWGHFDGVIILTPHTLHYQQAKRAFRAGKHVLLEKPMVCKVAHARELLKFSKAKKLALVVSYQRHYVGLWRYAREVIQTGGIGRITAINGWLAQHWLPFAEGRWRGDPELSGGGEINDSGSHMLAVVLWMTGLRPKQVHAFVDNRSLQVDVTSSISVRFAGGALACFSIVGDSADGFREALSIWGEKGSLYFRGGGVDRLRPDGRLTRVRKLPGSSNPERNFVDVILGRDQVHSGGEIGLAATRLTAAIYRSARTGKPVRF